MPTSNPAMRAAYERTPSIQRCQEIVLALMTTRTPPGFQGPPGLPPWGHPWTVEDLVLASQEYQQAVNKLSIDLQTGHAVNVTQEDMKEAFMNRYGAAVRVLAGHASRKATQEHPVRKLGGRFWGLKVAPSELPAPGPTSELQGALAEIKGDGPQSNVKSWDLAEKTEPPVVNQNVSQLKHDLELLLDRDQKEETPPVDPPRVDPFEAPAPEPCILRAPPETAKAAEPRWPEGISEEARPDLEMAILALSESLFSSPAATGENFIPLLHVIYAARKLGLRREAIGELVSSGVQVALRKWEANKAATDKAMREYLADPGEV